MENYNMVFGEVIRKKFVNENEGEIVFRTLQSEELVFTVSGKAFHAVEVKDLGNISYQDEKLISFSDRI